jgi:hypothetical protein
MRVVCAWCEKEGLPAVMREEAPLEDTVSTHGVCPDHRALLIAQLTEVMRAWSSPERPTVPSDADPK